MECEPTEAKSFAAVLREDEVAGPVAAAAQTPAAGQVGEVLHGAAGREVAILVGEAHDGVGVADVDPLRIGAVGIEGDAEGLVQAVAKTEICLGLPFGVDAAEDLDFAGSRFRRGRGRRWARSECRRGLSRPVA